MRTFNSQNTGETQAIGQNFAKNLKGGDVVLLYGDLGDGKTTFVQGLAKGLGIERRIISPTFILMRTHRINTKGAKFFYHLDLYRMESEKNLEGLGLEEILGNKENITVIEWAEKIGKKASASSIKVFFKNLGEDKRRLEIHG